MICWRSVQSRLPSRPPRGTRAGHRWIGSDAVSPIATDNVWLTMSRDQVVLALNLYTEPLTWWTASCPCHFRIQCKQFQWLLPMIAPTLYISVIYLRVVSKLQILDLRFCLCRRRRRPHPSSVFSWSMMLAHSGPCNENLCLQRTLAKARMSEIYIVVARRKATHRYSRPKGNLK